MLAQKSPNRLFMKSSLACGAGVTNVVLRHPPKSLRTGRLELDFRVTRPAIVMAHHGSPKRMLAMETEWRLSVAFVYGPNKK